MGIVKTSFEGNSFVGLFARASDEYVIIPSASPSKFELAANQISQKVIKTSVASSPYIGLYCVANKRAVLMAPFCTQTEIEKITQQEIEVEIFENSKFCAIANNIACNDKIAIVNEQLAKIDIKKIEDALQVEAIPMKINQYYTVGMMISLTNRGFLVHNRIEEEQMRRIEQITQLKGINATINSGTPIVGLGIVANSKGALVGEATTGFETARIEQGLELIE